MSKLSDFIQTGSNGGDGPVIPPHYVQELHVATAGQQVFNLMNDYVLGYGSLDVMINGIKQTPNTSTYEETNSKQVTLSAGAEAGDAVLFQILEGAGNVTFVQEVHIATANQTVFNLGNKYQPNAIEVFVNGLLQTPDSSTYEETNAMTITLSASVKAGEPIVFKILKEIEA